MSIRSEKSDFQNTWYSENMTSKRALIEQFKCLAPDLFTNLFERDRIGCWTKIENQIQKKEKVTRGKERNRVLPRRRISSPSFSSSLSIRKENREGFLSLSLSPQFSCEARPRREGNKSMSAGPTYIIRRSKINVP